MIDEMSKVAQSESSDESPEEESELTGILRERR
eukprot:CAMPEP_0170471084 /NCGR_PEP_ID=MMETSP0123-20130129/13386_1 /TAXON_ID=182087 /ORGANISM="Favella ehrenbergii, Strain Fehren 1" /LENGTH=32 /DNA_ID= /DNA_START= /DNA_END= /DNA_ORIENTATION=